MKINKCYKNSNRNNEFLKAFHYDISWIVHMHHVNGLLFML